MKKLLILVFLLTANSFFIISQNIVADTVLANKHFETAKKYYNNKSYDTAIVYFENAAAEYEKYKLWREYLLCNTEKSNCFLKLRDVSKSLSSLKPITDKVLEYIPEKDTLVADAYYLLGLIYYYKSNPDSALLYYKKSLEIREELHGEMHVDVAKSYNNIGNVYTGLSLFDNALDNYFKALKIRKKIFGEENINVAMLYSNIGIIYNYKSDYNLCLEYFLKAASIQDKIFGDINQYSISSYMNIGIVYWDMSDFDVALVNFNKALKGYLDLLGENHEYTANCYNNIGGVYNEKSEFDLSLEYYFKSLKIRIALFGENSSSVASSYNNIGSVYMDKGDYDIALDYFNKSLKIKEEILKQINLSLAMSYNNIGNTYLRKKEYSKALKKFERAFSIMKSFVDENNNLIAASYTNLALSYDGLNEIDSALVYHSKALEVYKNIYDDKHSSYSKSYNYIGDIYYKGNRNNLALDYYNKSLANCLQDHDYTTDIYTDIVINNYNNWSELLKALNMKAKIFADIDNFKGASLRHSVKYYQACDTLISQVRINMKKKSDKISLGEKAGEVYKSAVGVCLKLAESLSDKDGLYYKEMAFKFSEKNKSSVLLEALAGVEAQKYAGIPDKLLKLEHKIQTDIAFYKKILAEEIDSLKEVRFKDKLFNANRSYDSLIAVFENKYPKYYELKYNQKPSSAEDIQNVLDKQTALISYSIGDSILTIFALTNKKFKVINVEKPDDLNKKIFDLRDNISGTDNLAQDYADKTHHTVDIYKKKARELYQILLPDELKKFLKKNIKNLIIIPEGKLAVIPFECLLTDNYNENWTDWNNSVYFTDMPFLVKDYNISYSYSANLFYETNPKTKDKPEFQDISDWLALAPVFDNDSISGTNLRTRQLIEKNSTDESGNLNTRAWLRDGSYISPLPGSEEETKNIFSIFEDNNRKAVLKTHKYANEEYVKSGILKDFKYLHIATHGMVNEDKPELSCILLAQDSTSSEDNILFSDEIYNLELNADLTVLSACETGLGKIAEGEGVIGLTRALLYAGSKNIIVSLWQVSDESTSQLMVDFYKNIFRNDKDGFSENLTKSKLKLINEGKFAHPFFWSPFVLIGK